MDGAGIYSLVYLPFVSFFFYYAIHFVYRLQGVSRVAWRMLVSPLAATLPVSGRWELLLANDCRSKQIESEIRDSPVRSLRCSW